MHVTRAPAIFTKSSSPDGTNTLMRARLTPAILVVACVIRSGLLAQQEATPAAPGTSVLLDAHNAYPYQGRWNDHLERALSTGTPLAIEQDLIWRPATANSPAHSIVSHGEPFTRMEPTLRDFFERMRPIMTRALAENDRNRWPVVTLNLDFKDSHPEHFAAIWRLLGAYEHWLTTAKRVSDGAQIQRLNAGLLLVLTGSDPAQRVAFHDSVPVGSALKVFGAVNPPNLQATNYARWSNNPWSAVEPEGQPNGGDWTKHDRERLVTLVNTAHAAGLWIRFYTLNGHPHEEGERQGWSPGYNFGSLDAARIRWRAAIDARVDFIATDQYEDFALLKNASQK